MDGPMRAVILVAGGISDDQMRAAVGIIMRNVNAGLMTDHQLRATLGVAEREAERGGHSIGAGRSLLRLIRFLRDGLKRGSLGTLPEPRHAARARNGRCPSCGKAEGHEDGESGCDDCGGGTGILLVDCRGGRYCGNCYSARESKAR